MKYIKFFRIKLRVFSLLVILFSQGIFPNNDKNLLILGDSISAGYGIPSEIQWVNILQELCNSTNLGVKIINASISGDTTLGGLTRIPKLLNKYSPEFLLIELGGNDALRGYPVKKIKDNLLKISEIALQNETSVIIMQMRIPPNYGPKYTHSFESIYTELSKLESIYLIPFMLEEVALNKDLMLSDGIHPNDKAQPLIANYIFKFLQPIIEKN